MDESQPITVVCPACGLAYEVEASMAGRRARCEGCGHKFILDRQTQVPVPPAAPTGP